MILIIDDELEFAKILKNELEKFYKDEEIIITSKFDEDYINNSDVDVIFLDIELGDENGIDLASEYRRRENEDIEIIFISSHENFEHNTHVAFPLYFIRKKYLKKDLDTCLFLLEERRKKREMPFMFGTNVLKLSDMIYAESRRNDVIYHFKDGSELKRRIKLSKVEEELKGYNFVRCHQSYIVNMPYVKEYFPYKSVILKNDKEIPTTEAYHEKILEAFREYLSKKWSRM